MPACASRKKGQKDAKIEGTYKVIDMVRNSFNFRRDVIYAFPGYHLIEKFLYFPQRPNLNLNLNLSVPDVCNYIVT